MSITECHNLDNIMTSESIVKLNMSKNHAFLVVRPYSGRGTIGANGNTSHPYSGL